ncbi:interleukin-10 receptor subunit beta [Siniperca chuatsi]|uniref:Cytokine receptor family protein B5 n=1 Tax=Siniperca chuatsi TaxID=119488 RepID=A0A3S7H456_SINCH|nr:interleukin-10 receptor subunit beta [Siniperca chuatsi]AVJ47965.1 cytokine receptor family protein B5 [Siniperca chuatsi]
MAAALYVCLLFWYLQTNAVAVELTPPQKVTVMALNTNYTLSWDWDQSAAEGHAVTFTAQYVAKYKLKFTKKSPSWHVACEKTSHRSCDLSAFSLHYLGIFVLRVRANMNGHHSDWVQKEFCPDKDAAVGPPTKVDLSPAGSDLDVFISDPLTTTNSSMKNLLPKLYYHILYWERSVDAQALRPQTLSSSANVVTLPNLKAWTWYCVSIQSRYDFYNKSSSFTSPHCLQTEGATPWWKIFVYFLGSLVICFLVMLLSIYCLFWCYKTIKATWYPSTQVPQYLKEYLWDSPGSDIPRLITPDSESELLCDKVTVCPEPPVLEVHNPPPEALPAPPSDLEPVSSGRHSRQDSSGSGDSGVYSTGGSSSLRQPNSNQSSTGAEDSWQGPFDMEQVKMRDMAPGLKSQLLTADEGIVDMCV